MMDRCMKMMKERGCMGEKTPGIMDMRPTTQKDRQAASDLGGYNQKELECLFEDWLLLLEDEILLFVKDQTEIDLKQVSSHFSISENSATFVIKRLIKRGEINAAQIAEHGENR
ncbi:MAG: hypothetical protein D3926_03830 [Desulfobacteraceae bacterium]|nr:MAG: hypothetical protein D3926_03830 [Desulfobacteraceae bacterium]